MKIIYENDKKIRLDKFLSSNSSLTRNKVAQYINLGQVKVNGIVVNKAANIIKYKTGSQQHKAQSVKVV